MLRKTKEIIVNFMKELVVFDEVFIRGEVERRAESYYVCKCQSK